MQRLSDLRNDYSKAALDTSAVEKDPVKQFEKWFNDALESKVPEPNAMNLATINENGRPTSRIVLLKGIEESKFQFYTNYQSKKGKELEVNPACALTFFWPELERQVRIEGMAERTTNENSDAYFVSRPRGSQVGAWSSPQSSVVENRQILEERVREIETKFEGQQLLPRPHQWGGFQVTPFLFEFWQGRPNRLHDRIEYTLTDVTWHIHRLAP
jgi:pyridoxamine 5'-phosphate oxidase